ERMYVVKDVVAFASAIVNEEELDYGKNLSFLHHIEAFREQDRPFVEWLVDEVVAKEMIMDQVTVGGKGHKADKKFMILTTQGFEKLFDILEGQSIPYEGDGLDTKVTFVKENPVLFFKVEKEEEQFSLTLTRPPHQIIKYPKSSYIMMEDRLYKCTKSYAAALMPILIFMQDMHTSVLAFNEMGWQRFVLTILPKIKRQVALEMDPKLLEDYDPPKLEIKLFLDKDSSNNIVGKVNFKYGHTTFNPYDSHDQAHIDTAREVGKEHAFGNLLAQYPFKNRNGQIHLDDEESIYNFLNEGVETLLPLAEVHISEDLKLMKFKKPAIGAIGIKIESDLLKVDFQEINMSAEEIQAVIFAYKQKKKYYRLKSGAFINAEGQDVEQLVAILEGLDLDQNDLVEGEVSLPKFRALYLDQILKKNDEIQVERDKYFKQIIRDIKNVEDTDYEVPASLKRILRSYQKVGYRWLKTMAAYGFGGILADDMGLGKTLQVIALILSEREIREKPSLVVAPTSLVLNWEREIEKFAPELKVLVLTGDWESRQDKIQQVEKYDVIVTSYDTLKRDIELYTDLKFRFCIADEAHYIKNPNTQNAKALKMVQSEVRFALTGTPIENTLAELWSGFDFVMPGYLYNYLRFKGSFETPIVKFEDERATERLRSMVAPFIIRRLKKDVLKELPAKTETIIYNKMEEEQATLYKAHLAMMQREFNKEVKEKGMGKSHIKILAMLTRLRQLCCHPGLFLEDYSGGSSKLEQCMELIEDSISAGHKILLFSQFTSMLGKIEEGLEACHIRYYKLTGETKAENRLAMVEAFNEDTTPIFLISLKAGGTGLNLTGADIVIHYDPWWNVSSENQATDRAYRIGQEKNVQVFKLITQNTIEEKIKELQERKTGLADNVLTEGHTLIGQMNEDEIRDLFTLD
ncbi:MAG: SNF2 helicase associated domain-containing protein, partial [Niameybacter sp.]